jgi:hypothetical protein
MAKRMQYGEETVVMRVPKSMVSEVKTMMENRKVIESNKAEILKDDPKYEGIMETFLKVCSAQMVELLQSVETDLISQGRLDEVKYISSKKNEFQAQVGVLPEQGAKLVYKIHLPIVNFK